MCDLYLYHANGELRPAGRREGFVGWFGAGAVAGTAITGLRIVAPLQHTATSFAVTNAPTLSAIGASLGAAPLHIPDNTGNPEAMMDALIDVMHRVTAEIDAQVASSSSSGAGYLVGPRGDSMGSPVFVPPALEAEQAWAANYLTQQRIAASQVDAGWECPADPDTAPGFCARIQTGRPVAPYRHADFEASQRAFQAALAAWSARYGAGLSPAVQKELLSPPTQVTLFADRDYGGAFWGPFGPGRYPDFRDIPGLNDAVSSLTVAPGTTVTLFTEIDFGGDAATFVADAPWAGDSVNDRFSSMVVSSLTPPGTPPPRQAIAAAALRAQLEAAMEQRRAADAANASGDADAASKAADLAQRADDAVTALADRFLVPDARATFALPVRQAAQYCAAVAANLAPPVYESDFGQVTNTCC